MAQTLRDFLPGTRYQGDRLRVISDADASHELDKTDSGTVFIATADTGTQEYLLPLASNDGAMYTFICGHADGEILITPQDGEAISIVIAGGTIVTPAAGTGVKNTAATNAVTDLLTIFSDGTQWLTLTIASGVWASQ